MARQLRSSEYDKEMKKRKIPQQKKFLSLKKDCRNLYGENAKASRKAIRLRKRFVNRQNRKRINDLISGMNQFGSIEELDNEEGKLARKKTKRWQKSADTPLAEAIKHGKMWRILREGRKKRSRNATTERLNTTDPRLNKFK